MAGTITVSASYGTEGALVAREVANRLGISFLDRAIPVTVAQALAIDPDEALEMDWRAPGRMERFMSALANASLPFGYDDRLEVRTNPDIYRQTTEDVLRKVAETTGGVILGRASSVVLRGRHDVLHVRLDGPVEDRIQQTMKRRGAEEALVREEQRQTDDARETYLKIFYGASQYDPRLYNLMLDATKLSRDACVDIILRAATDSLDLLPR